MPTARTLTSGSASQGANIIRETVRRLLGALELGASFVGVLPFKQLRVRVVILRDDQGEPLCTPQDVMPSLEEARRLFAEQAHMGILDAEPAVVSVPEPAPAAALDVHCEDGAWQEDLDLADAYFRRLCARGHVRGRR